MPMDFPRRFVAAVCFLGFNIAAHANLFHVDISTRTYTLNSVVRGHFTLGRGIPAKATP